eukprot:scaffold224642_cov20-Tisochrysis_lutea.AAC.1
MSKTHIPPQGGTGQNLALNAHPSKWRWTALRTHATRTVTTIIYPKGWQPPTMIFSLRKDPETQANTQDRPNHIGRTRKRKNPHADGSQPNLRGTPPNQDLSLNPTRG